MKTGDIKTMFNPKTVAVIGASDEEGLDPDCIEHTAQYPHLVITPYPTRYVTTWRMKDRAEVTLRPIRPEDEPLEHELLSTLSEETLRLR